MPNEDASTSKDSGPNLKLLDLLGGEQLEGSGFEAETPEPDFEWRDPR